MRLITKIVSVTAAAALILAAFAHGTSAAVTGSDMSGDFSVGDRIGGYTVESATDFSAYDSTVYVFVHDLTGAKVEYIKNSDPNRYFMMEFETPSYDNRGTAHVFEHSAMNGSVKYPSRSLVGALRSRSYVTFMNAFTKEACTAYPVASLSEEQLLKLADFYADSCFEPLILEDEDIFRSEAWRLSLNDPKGQLQIGGTIYSEMSGSYTADVAAVKKAMGLLYPNCTSSYVAGGIPQEILKLKYEDVKKYHETYYTPSNCIAYLCGDIEDPKAFLDLLDSYFVKFDRKTASDQIEDSEPAPGYKEMQYDFPAPSSPEDAQTEMVYAIDLGQPSDREMEKFYAFAKCINLEYSTPQLSLRTVFPGSRFGFALLPDNGHAVLTISAGGMNESEAPLFRKTLTEIFSDMAQNGISDNELSYFRNRMMCDVALAKEGESAGINLLISIANYNSQGFGELFYINLRQHMSDMEWFDNDLVKDVAATYLADPKSNALSVVTCDGKLYDDNLKTLSDALETLDKTMSEEERADLVRQTKRVVSKTEDDPTKYLRMLNVVKVSDLTDDVRSFEHTDTTDDLNVRRIGVYTDDKDVSVTRLYLDVSGIDKDMLGYVALYTDLVNGNFIPTTDHERGELPRMISTYTAHGQEISYSVTSPGEDFRPYVLVEFMSSPEDTQAAYDLAYERLFDTVFDDPARIREGIRAVMNTVRSNIENNPEKIACYLASSDAKGIAYYEYTHYIEYYDFLCELDKNIGGDFKNICARLKNVGNFLHNSDAAVVGYALAKECEDDYLECADDFLGRLDNSAHAKCDYDFEKRTYPLAVLTGNRVVSNAIGIGNAETAKLSEDAVNSLVLNIMNEQFLEPMTRDTYGAYRSSFMDRYPAFAAYTGSDPVIPETFAAFSKMGDAWRVIREKMTQEDLDGYIITGYANESLSSGELSDASSVISDIVSGRGADYDHQKLEALKNVKLEDLDRYDKFFDMLAGGNAVTVGSEQLILQNGLSYANMLKY